MIARGCSVLLVVSLGSVALASCSSTESAADGPSQPAVSDDAGASTAPPAEDGAAPSRPDGSRAEDIPATEYCETTASFFCDFYLRCGRMVAADVTECRAVFAETCNARYEPRYVDLERAKLLSLSRAGVDACAAHLATVTCGEQPSDLDGPCSGMWRGSRPAGAACAIDVESFVCGPGTTCILGLDFCGTCEVAAARGGACGGSSGARCATEDACVAGACVGRALPGQPCSDEKPCLTGATCAAGTCVAPEIVGEGAACDAKHRCAYRSFCEGGRCVRSSLLGEPCTSARACASGRCEAGTCKPLRAEGEACAAHAECSSAQCAAGKCTSLPTACLTR